MLAPALYCLVLPTLQTAPSEAAPLLPPALAHAAETSTEGEVFTWKQVWEQPVSVRDAMRIGGWKTAAANSAGNSTGLPAIPSSGTVNQDPEGDMPRDLVFTPSGSQVLIACRDTDRLTVFDVANGQISATYAVGDFPVDVAVSPDGHYAALPCVLSNEVAIVDLTTGMVSLHPVTGDEPFQVAFTSDSTRIVTAVINNGGSSSISVLQASTGTELYTFPTTPQGAGGFFATPESGIFGNLFTQFAVTPDDSKLVLPDGVGDQVMVYNLANGAVLAALPCGDFPRGIDISADSSLAVVTNLGSTDALSVIDLTSLSLTSFPSTADPSDTPVRITPDKAYAIVAVLNAVSFVALNTGAVAATLSTGTVGDIELSFDGQFAMVSNFNTSVIRLSNRTLAQVVPFAACADAAASPVEHKFAALNNRFREDIHLYSTNGASSAFLAAAQTGPLAEGDAPRALALSYDGDTALVSGHTSDNVITIDVATGVTTGYIPTGQRTFEIATSMVSDVAVAVNTESDTASVINLATGLVEATLSVPSRPSNVVISPDGTQAFILSVAGTDRVYFVDLQGPASAITGSVVCGQTGSILYTYGVMSGMAVSPDGSMLAVCISFDDQLLLLDTQTRAVLGVVPVGDFPIRVAFAPDGQSAYVANSFGDSLQKIDLSLAVPAVTAQANGIDFPLQITLDASGAVAYVGSFGASRLYGVNTQTMSVVSNLLLSGPPRDHARMGDQLFVAQVDNVLARFHLAGAATALVETAALSGSPPAVVFSTSHATALTTDPGADDLVNHVRFGGTLSVFCAPSNVNSAGLRGVMFAEGTFLAGGHPLRLQAARLPQNQFGYFLVGTLTMGPIVPSGSQGNFCLAGSLGRFNAPPQILFTGNTGTLELDVDTLSIPLTPNVPILAGQTWNFQCWHRDQNPGNTSNFTSGVSITFE